jgi:DNA repair photolyase
MAYDERAVGCYISPTETRDRVLSNIEPAAPANAKRIAKDQLAVDIQIRFVGFVHKAYFVNSDP